MSCGMKEAIVFCMGLVTGTGTTLTGKVLYGIESVGLDGELRKFEKPIFQTWAMFFAMIFALPIHYAYHWYVSNRIPSGKLKAKRAPRIPLKTYFLLAIPSAFDLIATFFANVGLLYITVSSFQLMKCTVIIFVALLKVFILKDHFEGYMWIGVVLNTVAVFMVGLTSLGDASNQVNNAGDDAALGLAMVVLSCFIQSGQYVFEEKLMDANEEDNAPPPLLVVGMEGVWGLIFTSFIVYPIAYIVPGGDIGSHERFDDAWTMLTNSSTLQIVLAIYLLAILGYNVFAVFVTYLLNSVWHAILDNFRPITVWGLDLLLFYVFTKQSFGEKWTCWSWLQLGGMIILLFGTAVYNGSIKLPTFKYPEPETDYEVSGVSATLRTPKGLASSDLSRSPLIARNARKVEDLVRRTPDQKERKRIREEYLTEYHGKGKNASSSGKGSKNTTGYGSMEV